VRGDVDFDVPEAVTDRLGVPACDGRIGRHAPNLAKTSQSGYKHRGIRAVPS
jgi:hypothetical protein